MSSANRFFAVDRLYLDRLRLKSVDHLELFTGVTHVYLQHNLLTTLADGFDYLPRLRFLSLSHNRVLQLADLTHLSTLQCLDLSHNDIETFDVDWLPSSLVVLNLAGNPCQRVRGYRSHLIVCLPNLRQLDGGVIADAERASIEAADQRSSGDDDDDDDDDDGDGGVSDRVAASMATATLAGAGVNDADNDGGVDDGAAVLRALTASALGRVSQRKQAAKDTAAALSHRVGADFQVELPPQSAATSRPSTATTTKTTSTTTTTTTAAGAAVLPGRALPAHLLALLDGDIARECGGGDGARGGGDGNENSDGGDGGDDGGVESV
jgi:hypothetical protein